MRNIPLICDPARDRIRVGGEEYAVLTNYRRWLVVYDLLTDDGGEAGAKKLAECAACAVCPELLTGAGELREGIDAGEVLSALAGFLLRREGEKSGGGRSGGEGGERVFDFVRDAELIYSSFLSAYAIDLSDPGTRLHWHAFCALLYTLPPESALMRMISLRTLDTDAIDDDRERRRMKKLKRRAMGT